MSVPTVFGLLLIRLQADFDLDGCNWHDLHTFASMFVFCFPVFGKNGAYLVCTAYSFSTDLGQANIIEFSFLHHFVQRLGILLDFVIRIASRWLE